MVSVPQDDYGPTLLKASARLSKLLPAAASRIFGSLDGGLKPVCRLAVSHHSNVVVPFMYRDPLTLPSSGRRKERNEAGALA